MELRARLIANNDDSDYEKGDKITFYHFKIFLNSDEKHGKNDAFDVNSVVALATTAVLGSLQDQIERLLSI